MATRKPMSKRELADFIADNTSAVDNSGMLVMGPWEQARKLGFITTEAITLSRPIARRVGTSSSQNWYLGIYINNVRVYPDGDRIDLRAGDLFEIGLSTDDGENLAGRVYISYEVS